MPTDTSIRNSILRRIQRLPENKLNELKKFVDKLDQPSINKSETLSFAGSWGDIDDSLFSGFTEELISKRKTNKRRFE
ncbi:MAG: hypothetical protein PVH88_00050 [Ignavibacteria bacterium]|jgi:hypothetical protein